MVVDVQGVYYIYQLSNCLQNMVLGYDIIALLFIFPFHVSHVFLLRPKICFLKENQQ